MLFVVQTNVHPDGDLARPLRGLVIKDFDVCRMIDEQPNRTFTKSTSYDCQPKDCGWRYRYAIQYL